MLKFLTNVNLAALTKGIKLDLNSSNFVRKAKLLALCQLLRVDSLEPGFGELFKKFYMFKSNDLKEMHHAMEKMRLDAREHLKHLMKNFSNIGYDVPIELEDHVKATNRALEIWIVTIGTNINPKIRKDVIHIWEMLINSKDYLSPALDEIYIISDKTKEHTGSGPILPDKNTWEEYCEFEPTIGLI